FAALTQPPPDAGGAWQPLFTLAADSSGAGNARWSTYLQAGNIMGGWNGSSDFHGGLVVGNTGTWQVLVWTKTVAAQGFWQFVYSTGVWQATTGSGLSDTGTPGATGLVYVAAFNWTTGDVFPGTVGAVAFWPRVLTDGEIKRLPGGRWSETGPLVHVEFAADDNLALAKDIGRAGLPQSANSTLGPITKTKTTDPPGFRYSVLNRRR
ncbi:MAG TPA: hypothetical protein VFQ26_05475, partial [Nitrospiraceae bacterium]|nr:hypothetical protein [Nitrospiraceae bacterium]